METKIQEKHRIDQKKDDYKHRNKKLKFSYNEQREYETIEDDIANLEEKLGSLVKR